MNPPPAQQHHPLSLWISLLIDFNPIWKAATSWLWQTDGRTERHSEAAASGGVFQKEKKHDVFEPRRNSTYRVVTRQGVSWMSEGSFHVSFFILIFSSGS